MWPFDRAHGKEYLRVGRHSMERWVGSPDGLSLTGSCALTVPATPPRLDPQNVESALHALYPAKPRRSITVLLDSVWLPVLLADVGTAPWTAAQVEPLLRHRLHLLQGGQSASAPDWELRVDHRAGDRFALGYGLPLGLKQLFVDVGGALGLRWSSMLPAFAWGLQWLRPARDWAGRSGWWAWPEQDRVLLARIASNRIVVLNAAANSTEDPAQITRMVEIERARSGTQATAEPIAAATWGQARYHAMGLNRLAWLSIARRSQLKSASRTVLPMSKRYP